MSNNAPEVIVPFIVLSLTGGLEERHIRQIQSFVGEVRIVEVWIRLETLVNKELDPVTQIADLINSARFLISGTREGFAFVPPEDPHHAAISAAVLYGIFGFMPPMIRIVGGNVVQVASLERARLIGQNG